MPDVPNTGFSQAAGVYLHVPFCQRKCAYCDFVSYAGRQSLIPDYVQALGLELAQRAPAWRETTFFTLYLGGGTPSLLSPALLETLMGALRQYLRFSPGYEFTLEANPGTLTGEKLEGYLRTGLTRLSLGVQSFDDQELALLGRIHTSQQARQAVSLARAAGIHNLSLDLMFGLPGQNLPSWRTTLEQALDLAPEHLSLYGLTIEDETPLACQIAAGEMVVPDDDLAADMYELAQERLAKEGYVQYEISNWARADAEDQIGSPTTIPHPVSTIPSLASRHNLIYWRNQRYLGLGVAAHSFDGQHRTANISDLTDYIEAMRQGQRPLALDEALNADQRMDETMMLGLRLLSGVTRQAFSERFGVSLDQIYGEQIAMLVEQGLLDADACDIRLSRRGILLGNRVFGAFLR